MIHIKKSTDKKFYVTIVSDNNEVLNTSETLNTKQSAWINISAVLRVLNVTNAKVSDDTIKNPIEYICWIDGRKIKI